jgi:hypothetical protein
MMQPPVTLLQMRFEHFGFGHVTPSRAHTSACV